MSERETALQHWQAVRYGDTPETRLALAYYRERGWPVDDQYAGTREYITEARIDAFKAGYRAAQPVDAPQPCPHCKLPPVLPETCTPELGAVIEQQLAERWGLLNAGVDIGQRLAGDAPQPCEWRDIATAPKNTRIVLSDGEYATWGQWSRVEAQPGEYGAFEGFSFAGGAPFDFSPTLWTPLPPVPTVQETPIPSGQE